MKPTKELSWDKVILKLNNNLRRHQRRLLLPGRWKTSASLLLLLRAIENREHYIWNKHKSTARWREGSWLGPVDWKMTCQWVFGGFFLPHESQTRYWRSQQPGNANVCIRESPKKSHRMGKVVSQPSHTQTFQIINVLLLTNTTEHVWPHPSRQQRLRGYLDFHAHEAAAGGSTPTPVASDKDKGSSAFIPLGGNECPHHRHTPFPVLTTPPLPHALLGNCLGSLDPPGSKEVPIPPSQDFHHHLTVIRLFPQPPLVSVEDMWGVVNNGLCASQPGWYQQRPSGEPELPPFLKRNKCSFILQLSLGAKQRT